MKNKLVIDIKLLEDYDISINEFCTLWLIYNSGELNFNPDSVDYKRLQKLKFIKIIVEDDNEIFILRKKSIELIENQAKKSKKVSVKKQSSNIDVLTRIEEYRSIWKGLKPGVMGSPKSCKEKLQKWLDENPEYTFDDVLKAAKLYIKSLDGTYTYLQRADYFISKANRDKVEESRLSAFIEELDTDFDDDWTTNII